MYFLWLIAPNPSHAADAPAERRYKPISEVISTAKSIDPKERFFIKGVVTYAFPDGSAFVQDATGDIYAHTKSNRPIQNGDLVQVEGSISGTFSPTMQLCIITPLGRGPEPRVVATTAEEALRGGHDMQLIQLEGRLSETRSYRGDTLILAIQSGPVVFTAELLTRGPADPFPGILGGSTVQVTGACSVNAGARGTPRSFRVFLRNPHDLLVLKAPPWWNLRHALTVLLVAGLASIATALWNFSLRRQVRSQTAVIQTRLESEAVLARQYHELFDHASDLVYFHDPTGQLLSINPAGRKLTGYDLAQIQRMNLTQLVVPEQAEAALQMIERTVRGQAPVLANLEIITRDKRRLTLEFNSHPLLENGQVTRVQGIARDITERRRLEMERAELDRKLQEGQRLESLGVLAGGIAHDFNNLLTSILGNASLARLELPPNIPAQDCLAEIEHTSHRAADLCKQMLAYSGKGRFVVQRLDLSALATETTQMIQLSINRKVDLKMDLEKNLPPVLADATQLRQIIMNLVINASDSIGDNPGIIHISTGAVHKTRDQLDTGYAAGDLPGGDYVYLKVQDTGPGMSPETKARIFEPFFTTKFTGRGLGLAAVLGIVRGHKGGIKVDSEPGRGATFELLLPVAEGPLEHADSAAAGVALWRGAGLALVVDDEESVRIVVEKMLRALGFEVIAAADGVEAMAMWQAHRDELRLVLLDFNMPRMNGVEALHQIRRVSANLPVLMTSGYTGQQAGADCGNDPRVSFIQKPFTSELLRESLRTLMSSQSV